MTQKAIPPHNSHRLVMCVAIVVLLIWYKVKHKLVSPIPMPSLILDVPKSFICLEQERKCCVPLLRDIEKALGFAVNLQTFKITKLHCT